MLAGAYFLLPIQNTCIQSRMSVYGGVKGNMLAEQVHGQPETAMILGSSAKPDVIVCLKEIPSNVIICLKEYSHHIMARICYRFLISGGPP